MKRKAEKDSKHRAATHKANLVFYANHPKMKGKQISKTNTKHANFRKEWMDLYIKYGGTVKGNEIPLEKIVKQSEKPDSITTLSMRGNENNLFKVPEKYGVVEKPKGTQVRFSRLSLPKQSNVFKTINERLEKLGICISKHIATDANGEPVLKIHSTTLDGIEFKAIDAQKLKNALDSSMHFAGVKSHPNNIALKCSFGVTKGIGWRELWKPRSYESALQYQFEKQENLAFLGPRVVPFYFSALHCSLESGDIYKIHIDENGFFIAMPNGISMTPDFYSHTVGELLIKTWFRDALNQVLFYTPILNHIRDFIIDVFNRTSIIFPSSTNGFIGVKKDMWRLFKPIGASVDLCSNKTRINPCTYLGVPMGNNELKINYTKVNDITIFSLTLGAEF